jgi:CYTH domain-containing protein
MKLEIERKFLLKSLPSIKPTEIINIQQYYYKNDSGIWERARTWNSNLNGLKYIHTIKKSVSKGVNLEDEHEMTEEEFLSFKDKCFDSDNDSKFLIKERWIYPDSELIWEVDIFKGDLNIVIAEVETPTKDYKVSIPKFISDKLLLEVTEHKQFSNRSLSSKIKNKK